MNASRGDGRRVVKKAWPAGHRLFQRCLWLLGAAALAAGQPGVAMAAEEGEVWEVQSVRELMQQDLRRALEEPPPPAGGSKTSAGNPARVHPVLAPRLVALYGVGRALMAEVQVGREAYLYVRGQAYPAGHAGDRNVYQLRDMNGACVRLERGEDRHSLCLRMLLGEVQP